MRVIWGLFALASLIACLALPVLHFQGSLDNQAYKDYFLIASVAWFVFAISWAVRGKSRGAH
jgi:hypothetical protein